MKNFYEALQVKNFAEDEVIKASYKALSKKYHPDVNASAPEEWMMQINEAYEVLGNPEKKKEYDQELRMQIGEDQNLRSEGDAPKDFHEDIYASEIRYNSIPKKVVHAAALTVRIPISIVVAIILGGIGSFIIVSILDSDSSWLFVLYTIYGSIMGTILGKISDCDSPVFAIFGALLTIVGMMFPYYWYYFDTIGNVYENVAIGEIILNCTGEIVRLFLKEGFVRAAFTILAPVATFSAIIDRL